MIFSFIFIFEGFVEMELFPIFNSYYYSLKCTMKRNVLSIFVMFCCRPTQNRQFTTADETPNN